MVNKRPNYFTVNQKTQASNPGNLRVDYFYWIRSFPDEPIRLILSLGILVVLYFLINWIFDEAFFEVLRRIKILDFPPFSFSRISRISVLDIVFSIPIYLLLKQLIFPLLRIRQQFLYGCVNPGVVVSSKPPVVAVLTDLTTSKVPHYTIKILPQPLKWMKNGVPPVGTRIATVALYEGNIKKGYWDDFHPIVIDCVTGNQNDIDRVFQSIPNREWQELAAGMEYIETTKVGLHTIPCAHCSFCNQLIFFPLYPMHKAMHAKPLADG
jgi:hypothetical protein